MKWFKHLSGSLNNSIIAESIERFGGDGYMVFFGILELVSDEFDIYKPGVKRLRMKKITKNLQLSRQKTVKILTFFDQKAKENPKKNVSFYAEVLKDDVIIKCNRLADLCDNHTQKLLRDASKSLQSKDEVTSLQEEEGEEEVRSNSSIINNTTCPQKEVVDLWCEIMPELTHPKKWEGIRSQNLRTRWREDKKRQNLEWWKKLFNWMRKSNFLMGKVSPPPGRQQFSCSLDWLVKNENFLKVLEGKYHN